MMTRLSEAVQSYQVKSKGVKKLVKRLEEPGFPASMQHARSKGGRSSADASASSGANFLKSANV